MIKEFTDDMKKVVEGLYDKERHDLLKEAEPINYFGFRQGFDLATKANGRDVWYYVFDENGYYFIDDGEFVKRLMVLGIMNS